MKDSFILYTEQKEVIDKLSDEQAGKLIKAIYKYVETEKMPELDKLLDIVIIPFKQNLDRNKEKYNKISEIRAKAGAKGGKQKKQKQTKEINCNDNVNENENVNDNVNVNELKDSCTELPAQSAAISMPLNDGSEYPVFDNAIKEWEKLYPAVDVMQELRNMRGWLMSNPTRRKTKAGIKRFITGWLAKEQNKGRSAPMRAAPKSPQDNFPATKRDWSYLVE